MELLVTLSPCHLVTLSLPQVTLDLCQIGRGNNCYQTIIVCFIIFVIASRRGLSLKLGHLW